jgi:hypothetical protein
MLQSKVDLLEVLSPAQTIETPSAKTTMERM